MITENNKPLTIASYNVVFYTAKKITTADDVCFTFKFMYNKDEQSMFFNVIVEVICGKYKFILYGTNFSIIKKPISIKKHKFSLDQFVSFSDFTQEISSAHLNNIVSQSDIENAYTKYMETMNIIKKIGINDIKDLLIKYFGI